MLYLYCNSVKVIRLNLTETQVHYTYCLQQQAETTEYVLYCPSQLRSMYRRHVFSDMATTSQDIAERYKQMFTRNILYLLFDSDGENKRTCGWYGRPCCSLNVLNRTWTPSKTGCIYRTTVSLAHMANAPWTYSLALETWNYIIPWTVPLILSRQIPTVHPHHK